MCFVCQLCWILCNPVDYSPPDSSVHETLQERILEWVAISFSRESSQPRNQTWIFCIADGLTLHHLNHQGKHQLIASLQISPIFKENHIQFSSVTQSCPTLCEPMNRSTPGLPVHHQLLEFTQTHVHRVGDAIQPSHPLSSPSPPAPIPSQHQGLFK